MHANNVFSIRIISLYVSQPSFGVFACKTSTLGPKLQVSMIRRSHQWFFAFKTASLAPELQVSMGPSPHLWCMENNENSIRITSLHVSQTSPVVLSKQNNVRITSLYGSHPSSVVFACKTVTLGPELQVSMGPSPHLSFFCNHNSVIMSRINSLYGSQTSPVVVCMQNNEISTRITSLH